MMRYFSPLYLLSLIFFPRSFFFPCIFQERPQTWNFNLLYHLSAVFDLGFNPCIDLFNSYRFYTHFLLMVLLHKFFILFLFLIILSYLSENSLFALAYEFCALMHRLISCFLLLKFFFFFKYLCMPVFGCAGS